MLSVYASFDTAYATFSYGEKGCRSVVSNVRIRRAGGRQVSTGKRPGRVLTRGDRAKVARKRESAQRGASSAVVFRLRARRFDGQAATADERNCSISVEERNFKRPYSVPGCGTREEVSAGLTGSTRGRKGLSALSDPRPRARPRRNSTSRNRVIAEHARWRRRSATRSGRDGN